MLVLMFSSVLLVLTPSGWVPFFEGLAGNMRHMILPVVTLAVGEAAYFLRTTRSAVTTVMARPFVTFLRAKGVSTHNIVFRHALGNAGPLIVTVIGIQVGVLLGRAIIVETLFALSICRFWPASCGPARLSWRATTMFQAHARVARDICGPSPDMWHQMPSAP